MSLLNWEAQSWTQYSRRGLTIGRKGRTTSLLLLSMLFQTQPAVLLAFFLPQGTLPVHDKLVHKTLQILFSKATFQPVLPQLVLG